MSDTESTPDPSEVSDDDIYGVIETDDETVTIDAGASPPEKPSFHGKIRDTIHANIGTFEDVNQWIIAQQHNGAFQTAYPFHQIDFDVVGNRITIQSPRQSIGFGHGLTSIAADEMYVIDDDTFRQQLAISNAELESFDENHVELSEDNEVLEQNNDGTAPARRPNYDLQYESSWLHGSSPAYGSNFEIFVPLERAEVVPERGRLFQVQWDTQAIFRYSGRSTSLTNSQAGLNCRQVFTVSEDVVPTHVQSTSHPTEVDVLEESADLISNTH
jgi:hypothetical protein